MAKIFLNVAKAVADLEDKGFKIQVLHPENILVQEESGIIRLLLSQSTIQKVENQGTQWNYAYSLPNISKIKY